MTQEQATEEQYNTVRAIHLATVAVLSFLFVLKFVRETKGRQLEDAD